MGRKSGFTIIEVSLFIALSAVLFVAVTVGVQNSLYQQRYNDSVQRFSDFLRKIYAEVNNTQNTVGGDRGRSDKAIYGKMVTFGEEKDFNGLDNKTDKKIFVYNIIGDDCANSECGGVGVSGTIGELKGLDASTFIDDGSSWNYAGMVYDYSMEWSSVLQDVDGNDFKGAILVVRNPRSGIVGTFVGDLIEVNRMNGQGKAGDFSLGDSFESNPVEFCVSPDGTTGNRANVKIASGARNSSGISVIYDVGSSAGDNECNTP